MAMLQRGIGRNVATINAESIPYSCHYSPLLPFSHSYICDAEKKEQQNKTIGISSYITSRETIEGCMTPYFRPQRLRVQQREPARRVLRLLRAPQPSQALRPSLVPRQEQQLGWFRQVWHQLERSSSVQDKRR